MASCGDAWQVTGRKATEVHEGAKRAGNEMKSEKQHEDTKGNIEKREFSLRLRPCHCRLEKTNTGKDARNDGEDTGELRARGRR